MSIRGACYSLIFSIVFSLVFQTTVQAENQPVETENLQVGDPQLDVLWIDEQNGKMLPLDLPWFDEDGKAITFGEFIDRPTLILPIYFYCPSSCSLNLVNLATAVKRSRLDAGNDFKIIAYSSNPKENEENARIAKRNYMRLLPDDFPQENWKFLTGPSESIEGVTKALGYSYKELADGTFTHPSALIAVAEDGKIIKYVYGKFVTGDVDLAVSEAESGIPALSIKRFLGYCFNYDPSKSRSFFQNLKVGVLLAFALFGVLFFFYVKRTGNKRKSPSDT